MTTDRRFEADLPEALADLYLGSMPAYRDTIIQRTAGHRQRAAWTFPERWIPMTDTTLGARPASRVPLRPIAYLILLVALALAIAAGAIIASRTKALPAPYGPAANGLVAYSSGGDIYTADPVTGAVTPIVTGPEDDRNPVFSHDGSRIVFRRAADTPRTTFNLVVADSDGSHMRVVTPEPLVSQEPVEWTADGTGLVAWSEDGERLIRFDADGGVPGVIASGINGGGDILWESTLRPPDNSQILFRGDDEATLMVMNADGSGQRTLAESTTGCPDFGRYAWSPDGTKVAFSRTSGTNGCDDGVRIYVANADGTNERQLTSDKGIWWEPDFAWAPASDRLAVVRWHKLPSGTVEIRPIAIAAIDGGPVTEVGPVSAPEGSPFEWSPDGSKIVTVTQSIDSTVNGDPRGPEVTPIEIDTATGTWRELPFDVRSAVSWQRIAP
jgi:dipeptidyl aminopeptidase/acylaminoacyl peptidase